MVVPTELTFCLVVILIVRKNAAYTTDLMYLLFLRR